ncbi:MAG: TolB family protein [Terriglobales bacterium]
MNAASGAAARLTDDLQGFANVNVAGNGAVVLLHAAPQYSLWVRDRAGASFSQIPGGGASQDGVGGVAWTPHDQLVFTRNLGGVHQVWTEAEDGSGARMLASGRDLEDPVVAPNGEILLDSAFHNRMWRMNADGTGLTPFGSPPPHVGMGFPPLIAGGTQVAYMRSDKHGNQTLWAMPLNGGASREISSATYDIEGFAALPGEGDRVLAARDSDRRLVVIRTDGAAPAITVTPLSANAPGEAPGWTPDGRDITFIQTLGSTANLWAFSLAGGPGRELTRFGDLQIAAYAFSHDGRLAISRGLPDRDVVLATGLAGKH